MKIRLVEIKKNINPGFDPYTFGINAAPLEITSWQTERNYWWNPRKWTCVENSNSSKKEEALEFFEQIFYQGYVSKEKRKILLETLVAHSQSSALLEAMKALKQ